jgi:hypothetical protein
MEAKIGDLVQVTSEMCGSLETTALGIIEEVYVGASFNQEYKIRWANPQLFLKTERKSMKFSWITPGDFEIISEN